MKKAGLKSRGSGSGSSRGGKQQQYHQRHYVSNGNNNNAGGNDGSSSSGENDAFLHNQNYTPAANSSNNAAMKNSGYQKGSNFQPMSAASNHTSTSTARHPQQQQQGMGGYSQAPQRQPQFAPQQQQHGAIANNNGGMANNNGNGPNALIRLRQLKQHQNYGNDEMALNQKNHRLAKELSDLRVRHREETQVVSRLTMENMNLASRCREAIAQVAALKKEIVVYQKRQSEWGTLQREVMLLRNQIDKNAAAAAASPSNTNSSGHNRSSSSGSCDNHKGEKQPLILPLSSSADRGLEIKRGSSPATDLDRIMSQQFRKQEKSNVANASINSGTTRTESVDQGNTNEKKEASVGLAKQFQDLHVSSSAALSQQQHSTSNGSHHSGESSTSSTKSNNNSSKHRPTSNAKIPISVTSSSTKLPHSQKDDEFDADIDMVDFFAKSQPALNIGSSSNNTSTPGGLSESSTHHLGSRTRHSRKPNSTDDHMPGDVISPSYHHQGGFSSSPSHNQGSLASTSPPPAGDNLLSSLDAFEASFASAFPETSFSITSEAPLSSAKLDMSFDVPEFDPFFKSPTNISKDNALSSSISSSTGDKNNDGIMKSQMQDLFPESAMKFKPSSPSRSNTMVFDYSNPMNFSPIDLSSEMKKGIGGSTPAMGPEKLDSSFVPVQMVARGKPTVITALEHSNKDNDKEVPQPILQKQRQRGSLHHHNRPSPLSPQSMSAEIEQLDAIANLASSEIESSKNANSFGNATAAVSNNNSSSCRSSTRSIRKVKQPVSYAEPSTKSKLRKGDVFFKKVDPNDKSKQMELDSTARTKGSVTGRGGVRAGVTAATPTTDLDRIMGQMSDMQ